MAVSAVKADEAPGDDALELVVDDALDIPFQALGLPELFLLHLFHLSFFSCRSTVTPLSAAHFVCFIACSRRCSIHRESTAGDDYLCEPQVLQGRHMLIY